MTTATPSPAPVEVSADPVGTVWHTGQTGDRKSTVSKALA